MSNRFSWLLALALALSAQGLSAQSRTAVALDATVGAATGRGGEFRDREMPGARLAASIHRWRASHVGVFGELSMDFLSLRTGHKLVCVPSPRGGCLDAYPEFYGPAATVGLARQTATRSLEGRVGLGGGAYRSTDATLVGAVVTQVDVAWLPAKHLGVVLGARWIVVPSYRHDRLSMMPLSIGLRVR